MEVRKAHVKRIYGDENQSYWIDVLRLDQIFISVGGEEKKSGQGKIVNLSWDDEAPDADGTETYREYEEIDVLPPETISVLPVKMKVIKKLSFTINGQRHVWTLDNSLENAKRETFKLKIPTRFKEDYTMDSPVPWEDYLNVYSAVDADTSQYVEAEIPKSIFVSNAGIGVFNVYNNEDVLDFVGDTPAETDTLARLDPFQMIVNVNWGGKFDIMYLVDASGSNSDFVDQYIINTARQMYTSLPGCRQGYANFIDYPILPYGAPGDFVYRLFSPLRDKVHQNYFGWSQYQGNGRDDPEAQLDALYECAKDPTVGWDPDRTKVILLFTDTSPHQGGIHKTGPAVIAALKAEYIYPVYIGAAFYLGLGETIIDQYPSLNVLLNATRNAIKWSAELHQASQQQ